MNKKYKIILNACIALIGVWSILVALSNSCGMETYRMQQVNSNSVPSNSILLNESYPWSRKNLWTCLSKCNRDEGCVGAFLVKQSNILYCTLTKRRPVTFGTVGLTNMSSNVLKAHNFSIYIDKSIIAERFY
jgi:hypothetical protein